MKYLKYFTLNSEPPEAGIIERQKLQKACVATLLTPTNYHRMQIGK